MKRLLLTTCLCACSPGLGPAQTPRCEDAEGSAVPNEGWAHVMEGTPLHYASNPPASGPHYPRWTTYKVHTTAVERPYWVHNLEHGAVILLHRPDAPQDVIDELKADWDAIPVDAQCLNRRAMVMPDPLLDTPVAMVAADRAVKADRLDKDRVKAFVKACRNQAPENVCGDGDKE